MKIAIISGGFDPIHSGHIAYIKSAALLAEKLIVCLNSDEWLIEKKGKAFLPFAERKAIVENIKFVNEVIEFKDDELGSCINGLLKVKDLYPNDRLIFCNGGDRNELNIPEMAVPNIEFKFSVGGNNKKNSSSLILKDWSLEYEERVWGKFYNLYYENNVKVKELVVFPGRGMSFQKHFYRNEIWLVSQGKCVVNYSKENPEKVDEITLKKHDHLLVGLEEWHQITNPFDVPCHIIEIQYGEKTTEDDIERLYFFDEKQ